MCDKAKVITQEDINLFKQRINKEKQSKNSNSSQEQEALTISLSKTANHNILLKKIMDILSLQEKGNCQILIQIPNGDAINKIATNFRVLRTNSLIEDLKKNLGSDIIIT